MNIDVLEYLLKDIGHTDWVGETNYDNISFGNLDILDNCLTEIEEVRRSLLDKLHEHYHYKEENHSATELHNKAGKILQKHIINEDIAGTFENDWFGKAPWESDLIDRNKR